MKLEIKVIKNKILVHFHLEEGCSQDAGEVSAQWIPINFAIYHPLFIELIQMAIDEWLGEHEVENFERHEVIFSHEIEHDGGAVTSEYFTPITHEISNF